MTTALNMPATTRRGGQFVVMAMALSIVIHLGLLSIPLLKPSAADSPRDLVISLRTVETTPQPPLPTPEIPDTPEELPQEEVLEETLEPEQQSRTAAAATEEPQSQSPSQANQSISSPPSASATSDPPDSSVQAPLTTRLLSAVRANLGQPSIPEAPSAIEPATVPELPATQGWINDYVGTVEPRVDQWENNDGSRQTRIVTASVQVYCGRARAATSAEIFNPQFAVNVMMFKECGRARPAPVDKTNPWLRRPGGE